jgi:RNA polymerase sigma factor (sigma-70 family)
MALLDRDLLARVLVDDDRHAFAELVRRHQSAVRSLLRRLTGGDYALADDLAQETFLKAYQGLRELKGDASLSAWLYRIAYNLYVSHGRKRRETVEAVPAEEVTTEPSHHRELRHDLDRALLRLRIEERTALALTYAQDISHEEAAAILHWPLGTLKTHVFRAKAQLRQLLADWAPEKA